MGDLRRRQIRALACQTIQIHHACTLTTRTARQVPDHLIAHLGGDRSVPGRPTTRMASLHPARLVADRRSVGHQPRRRRGLYDDQGRKYIDGFSSPGSPCTATTSRPSTRRRPAGADADHSTFLGFTHEPGTDWPRNWSRDPRKPLSRVLLPATARRPSKRASRWPTRRSFNKASSDRSTYTWPRGYAWRHARRRVRRRDRPVPSHLRADPAAYPDGVVTGRANPGRPHRSVPRRCSTNCGSCWPRWAIRCARSSSNRWSRPPEECSPTTQSRSGVRALSTQFGAYLMVDEVATGIGRTGRMWRSSMLTSAPTC